MRIRSRDRLSFFLLATMLTLPLVFGDSHAEEIPELADRFKRMEERVGAFSCTYDLTMRSIIPDYDLDRVFELDARVEAVFDGDRYYMDVTEERVWFPDLERQEEPQIVILREVAAHDGQSQWYCEPLKDRSRVDGESREPPPVTDLRNLWLRLYRSNLSDIFANEDLTKLGRMEFAMGIATGYEFQPDYAWNEDLRFRVWILDKQKLPARFEIGRYVSIGRFTPSYAVDVESYSFTDDGVAYPSHVFQRLYLTEQWRRVCYCEREFISQGFKANVEVTADTFAFELKSKETGDSEAISSSRLDRSSF